MGESLSSFGHEADLFFDDVKHSIQAKAASIQSSMVSGSSEKVVACGKEMHPSSYHYSCSSCTHVSPETGTVSQSTR